MKKVIHNIIFKIGSARGVTLSLLFVLLSISVSASSFFSSQKRNISIKDLSIQQAIGKVLDKSGYYVVYSVDNIKSLGNVTMELTNVDTQEALKKVLSSKGLTFTIKENNVIITKAKIDAKQNGVLNVSGRVVSKKDKSPIIGATITVVGKTKGTTSGTKGEFSLKVNKGDKIEISCVGMVAQTRTINSEEPLTIGLEDAVVAVDDVVVTGYGTKAKSSFTGAAVVVGREQLKSVGQRDILSALSYFVPGMELLIDNKAGSNPNRKPDILIRGRSSLSSSANTPTFIMDGMEITLDDVFDLNMDDVENITVLKDASATALYGARAANGVIVITSKRMETTKLRVSYNFSMKISVPDLSDYKLLNAEQKLDYEKRAGIYSGSSIEHQHMLDDKYDKRFKEMRRGVDTYWLSAPLHTSVSHNHSLNIYGGSGNARYMMSARYGDDNGLMKESDRQRYGINFRLSYNINEKIFFQNYVSISGTNSTESPFGSFGNYTKQNPYDRAYNADGSLVEGMLSTDQLNPLYEATVGNYNKSKGMSFSDNFEFKWYILKGLSLETRFNISSTMTEGDDFKSPTSSRYKRGSLESRGSYANNFSRSGHYELSAFVNYNKQFGDNSLLYLLAGFNMSQSSSDSKGFDATGFFSKKLDHISFASGFLKDSKPSGSLSRDRMLGISFNANYIVKDRYFIDFSLRNEGSSKYGKNDRFSPFWTAGLGWNIHKENFLKGSSVQDFRLRANTGVSGNNSFASYQAVTTYKFDQQLIYMNGMGANPMGMGNPNLKWEKTVSYGVGVDFSLKDALLNFTVDYYQRYTDNLLTDVTVAPSTGVSTVKQNLGEIKNTGIEARVSTLILKNSNIYWTITAMASHNKNKIVKVDESLKKLNEERNAKRGTTPEQIYEEGKSTSALMVVRSGGIDPATGKEIFIKRDGSRTYKYDAADKVCVGDNSPVVFGSLSTDITYKQWSLGIMASYRMGATMYNETLVTRVEGAEPRYNADERVFTSRWKEPGDIARFKDIKDTKRPEHTDRFVEDEYQFGIGSVNLSYNFNPSFCRKLAMQNLRLSFYANDVMLLSTVGQERGLDYPFARNFQFSLSTTF